MESFTSPHFISLVGGLMRQHRVPGLSIAIVRGDKVESAGFGNARLVPPTSCTVDTLFDIASSAKSLTAASVALLVDDQNHPDVQYETVMSKLLPEDFVLPGVGYTEGVTVEDVLGHRTGMAGHDSSYMGPQASKPDDARSITRNLRNLSVAAPLRSRYLYCNMMYTAATHLVEVKSQQPYSNFLHERFFQPLGMVSTTAQPEEAHARGFRDKMAMGYFWDKDTSSYKELEARNCPEGQGAGSIITSADDFIKWIKALLNREGPVNEKVYQGLVRMRSIVNPNARRLKPFTSPAIYSAGMEVYYYRGQMVVGHDGVIPGFGSRFIFLPDFKFGAVLLGNSSGAGAVATTLFRWLIDELLGIPETERPYLRNIKNERDPAIAKSTIKLSSQAQDGATAGASFGKQSWNKSSHQKHSWSEPRPRDQPKNEAENKANHTGKNKTIDKSVIQMKHSTKLQPRPGSHAQVPLSQETPLAAYVGKFWHPGYHTMTVEIKEDRLFVDATDRSMGFTLTFEHIRGQTRYTAHLCDAFEGGDDPVDAEFVFQDGLATQLGIDLEPSIRELVWFKRSDDKR